MRPAEVCSQLLRALDASEGRRRRRKRDTTPDAIGLELKRNAAGELGFAYYIGGGMGRTPMIARKIRRHPRYGLELEVRPE